jgi:formate C-acetyltransferase
MAQLMGALKANFEGSDWIHAQVTNRAPKYGNDDDYADDLMRRVFHSYLGMVTGRPNTRGGTYRVNMLPTTCHVYFGEVMGASPNGRKAGKPLSEGISPTQGADTHGPTAAIRSAAKMDHLRPAAPLNQKVHPPVVAAKRADHRRILYAPT